MTHAELNKRCKKAYKAGKAEAIIISSPLYVKASKADLARNRVRLLDIQITYLKQHLTALTVIAESLRRDL